jgi:hypothetical protein
MSKNETVEHGVRISKDYPVADVNIHEGEAVRWESQEEQPCIVVFEQGGPFLRWYFEIPARGTVVSGPAHGDLHIPEGDHLVYKYSVIFKGWQADPKVKVWR